MAGAGYKLFQTGDVLTAAQVNTYLNEQTVMVFANAAARTSALTSVLAEGMMSYLQDTNSVEVYNGSSWVNVGNAGDITEVQAGVGISIASGTGPIPVITNSSTDLITTAGDLLYGTAADTVARLGIGTAGQVLKVNSGATAPEWGAAAGGGGSLTKISTTTFSNVATQDIDSVFSSTYNSYLVAISNVYATTGSDDLQLQLRVSSTTSADTYYGSFDSVNYLGTSAITGTNSGTQCLLGLNIGTSAIGTSAFFYVNFPGGGGSSCRPAIIGNSFDSSGAAFNNFGYERSVAAVYTGFRLKSSSTNITGTVVVYGLEK